LTPPAPEISPSFWDSFDVDDADDVEVAKGLISMFTRYYQNRRHDWAGKDVPYHKPKGSVVTDVNLRHVHIIPLKRTPSARIDWMEGRTSDRWLIYARASCGRALLIAYVEDEAHTHAHDYDDLRAIADIANDWLHQHNLFPDMSAPF